MNNDFIPTRFNDLVVWAQNLFVNLGPLKEQLGVTDSEMTVLKKYGDDLDAAARMRSRAEDLWHDTVAYCDLIADSPEEDAALPVFDFFNTAAGTRRGGFKVFVRRLVRKIKVSAYYDKDVGQLLGVISHNVGHDFTSAQPSLRGTTHHLYNLLKYKKGASDGANIYCRANDGDYTLLGFTPYPEYQHHLLPAKKNQQYDYYAVYVHKGKEVGVASKTLTLLVPSTDAPEQP